MPISVKRHNIPTWSSNYLQWPNSWDKFGEWIFEDNNFKSVCNLQKCWYDNSGGSNSNHCKFCYYIWIITVYPSVVKL